MSLFHSRFLNILLVKSNYLVSTEVEHWSKMEGFLGIWSHLETADLITFTEKILNRKLHFFAVWIVTFRNLIRIFSDNSLEITFLSKIYWHNFTNYRNHTILYFFHHSLLILSTFLFVARI